MVSFDNIYKAFRKAVRHKGLMPCSLRFVENLEGNLILIKEQLENQSYIPGPYTTFVIHEPKQRMISAAPFHDRIVHHCLVNVIEPIYEQIFIYGCYANRKAKGVHQAIRDVQKAMRHNRYILHCDIRKYFPSIDHEILKKIFRKKIKDPYVLRLMDVIVDGSNEQEEVWDYFPGDDLFTPLQRRRGLPIGNLTSQFFANLYLNDLDHFIKEKLGCRTYMRYVDDLAVLDNDKQHLRFVCREIEKYVTSLRLRLHPGKRHIRPVSIGERFLGQIIFPDRRLLPKPNVRRFMRRMRWMQKEYSCGRMEFAEVNHRVQSWLGHAKQANTYALRASLFEQISFRRNTI